MKKLIQSEKVKYIYDIVAMAVPRGNQAKTKKAQDVLEKIGEEKFDSLYDGDQKDLQKLSNLILLCYSLRHNMQWEENLVMSLVNLTKPAVFDSHFAEKYTRAKKKKPVGRPRKKPKK